MKIREIISKLRGDPDKILTFVPAVPVKDGTVIPGVGSAIEDDECYLELYVETLRLERARSLGTHYHGAVYAFLTLAREGDRESHDRRDVEA